MITANKRKQLEKRLAVMEWDDSLYLKNPITREDIRKLIEESDKKIKKVLETEGISGIRKRHEADVKAENFVRGVRKKTLWGSYLEKIEFREELKKEHERFIKKREKELNQIIEEAKQ